MARYRKDVVFLLRQHLVLERLVLDREPDRLGHVPSVRDREEDVARVRRPHALDSAGARPSVQPAREHGEMGP